MRKVQIYSGSNCLIAVALASAFLVAVPSIARAQKDPNRPACTDAHCRKVEAFLRAHYCGESPYGNGPEDGCRIQTPKKPRPGIEVFADFNCEWSDQEKATTCHQRGLPSPNIRGILVRELGELGLPRKADGKVYFTVWKSTQFGWSLALAYYSHLIGEAVYISEVVVLVGPNLQTIVLRKVPFQKTNADVPDVTEWSPVDMVDVEGNGQLDVVLEADAYEDHWLEVVVVRNGSAVTIFSGLGYYL
jgi:hypothetical protein